jgi:ELWxxDGT repeat protein
MYWLDSLRSQFLGFKNTRRAKRARRKERSRGLRFSQSLRHEQLEDRQLLSVNMVADINAYTNSSSPQNITNVGGTVFFTANSGDANNDVELYKSDGTAAGTTQLTFGDRLSSYVSLTSFNGKLWFEAVDSVLGYRAMYTSDGTVAGTALFEAGGDALDVAYADANTSTGVVGSKYYFEAYDGTNGFFDLWVTDGTNAGTHADQPSNPNAPNYSNLEQLTNVNGKAFFEDYDYAHSEWALWKSDGTAGGTSLVTDLSANQPSDFTAVGSELYFEMYDSGASQYALWHSDGTAANTAKVADIGTTGNQFHSLTSFNSKLWFQVVDTTDAPSTNWALWSSDGTAGHTGVFKFNSSTTAVQVDGNTQMTVFSSALYLQGYDSTHGYTLWKSDGSSSNNATGTVQTGSPTPFNNSPSQETVVGTEMYFLSYNSNDGNNYDLWKTNGTSSGTMPVQTSGFARGANNINNYMTPTSTKVFFAAYDVDSNGNSPHGYEIWSSDGTNANTAMITDINTTTYNSNPRSLVAVGSEIFFTADTYSPVNGAFLWQSDGTAANTVPVQTSANVVPTNENNYIAVGSSLFFTAYNANQSSYDLWTTGTGLDSAVDIKAGSTNFSNTFDSSNANAFAAIGSELYFGAYDQTNAKYALWKSDGTTAGTKVVADLDPSYALAELTVVNGNLFFDQYDSTNAEYALYEYNGSTVSKVQDITTNGNGLLELTAEGSNVFFEAYDSVTNEWALWTSNGTTTTNLVEATNGTQFFGLTPFNSKLFFSSYDVTNNNWTMWTSDGTVAGTTQFLSTDGQPVYLTSTPDFTVVGSELFGDFVQVGGQPVLGKTDGTAAGTVIVQSGSSTQAQYPSNMANDGGTLVFDGYDSKHGYELWQSDGTSAGTLLTADIYPGATSSDAQYMTVAGSQVFFNATDGVHGLELWTATIAADVVTAAISGPTDGVTEQHRDFVLTASDSNSGNNSAGFSFAVDFGDGTTETISGQSGLTADHQYAATGRDTVKVIATNLADNVSSLQVSQVDAITSTELQGGNLALGGVSGNNAFTITKGTGSSFTIKDNSTTIISNVTPAAGEEVMLYPGNGTTTATINDSGTTKDTFTLGNGYVIFNKGTFVATMPTTWTVNGNNSTTGNVYNIVDTATGSINGGSGPNVYNVSNSGSLSGALSGGTDASKNLLSYSKYTTGVVVDLLTGSATAIDGGANSGISGIENVTGSMNGGDILIGDGNANTLTSVKGHNILIGEGGGDTIISASKTFDIMIAGKTNYDGTIADLQTILTTWKLTTTSNYSSQISTIESNSFAEPLNSTTAADSASPDVADTLKGNSQASTDWLFDDTNDVATGDTGDTVVTI